MTPQVMKKTEGWPHKTTKVLEKLCRNKRNRKQSLTEERPAANRTFKLRIYSFILLTNVYSETQNKQIKRQRALEVGLLSTGHVGLSHRDPSQTTGPSGITALTHTHTHALRWRLWEPVWGTTGIRANALCPPRAL